MVSKRERERKRERGKITHSSMIVFLIVVLKFIFLFFTLCLLNVVVSNTGKGSLAGAQKHGPLSRRNKRKNWKPAYFVLREKNLYIFKAEDDAVRVVLFLFFSVLFCFCFILFMINFVKKYYRVSHPPLPLFSLAQSHTSPEELEDEQATLKKKNIIKVSLEGGPRIIYSLTLSSFPLSSFSSFSSFSSPFSHTFFSIYFFFFFFFFCRGATDHFRER